MMSFPSWEALTSSLLESGKGKEEGLGCEASSRGRIPFPVSHLVGGTSETTPSSSPEVLVCIVLIPIPWGYLGVSSQIYLVTWALFIPTDMQG